MMLIHLREQNQIFRSFYNYFFVYLFFGKDYEILPKQVSHFFEEHLFIFWGLRKKPEIVFWVRANNSSIEENWRKWKYFFPDGKKMMNEVHKEDVNIWSGGIGNRRVTLQSQKLQIPSAFLNWISILP